MIKNHHFERISGLNCSEYLIRGVANYYSRDFQLMFIGSWGFDAAFHKDNSAVKYISAHASDTWELLYKYHGIQINYIQHTDYDDFLRLIRSHLSRGESVMTNVDLFWIPWTTQNYQRIHWGHMILIVGENSTGWICYDFFSVQENVLPYDHLKKCFDSTYTFNVHNEIYFGKEIYIDAINKHIQYNLLETNAFYKIRCLAAAFDNGYGHSLINSMPDLVSFQTCDFMETLNRLAQRRSQYSLMLQWLTRNYSVDSKYHHGATEIEACAAAWKSVWGMLQKAYLMHDRSQILDRISTRLREIAFREEALCKLILDEHSSANNVYKEHNDSINYSELLTVPLSIQKYANHKWIYSTDMLKTLHSQTGVFISDEIIQSKKIEAENTHFLLCPTVAKFDNISCVGQTIEIESDCSALSILCCSEFAHQTERIKVLTSHSEFFVDFNVTSWTWANSEFDQSIAWTGQCAIVENGQVKIYPLPRHIFRSIYFLPIQSYVKRIELPYCPNIHIFAISQHNYSVSVKSTGVF